MNRLDIITDLQRQIRDAKRDLRNAERGFFLSGEPWANSDGRDESDEVDACEARLKMLQRELKIATGEIEDDIPF